MNKTAIFAVVLMVSMGAQYRSANFIIETADPQFALVCCKAAERHRHDLAIEWLGQPMPNWQQPCYTKIQVGPHLGAGAATTFVFDKGEVFGWQMSAQGSAERIIDSVLPHEITHTIFASQFRRPVPRWADEGGATSVEHSSELNRHRVLLYNFLHTGRGIPFNQMFAMTEYPPDIMPLYAQSYSLADYLIQTGGKRKYVMFIGDGIKTGDWSYASVKNYGVRDLGHLQNNWLAWVAQGSLAIRQPKSPPR